MEPAIPVCSKCGADALRLTWTVFSNGTRHIRGDCAACGKFSQYVPQSPLAVHRADINGPYRDPRESQGSLFDD